jgi:hypothetical protein
VVGNGHGENSWAGKYERTGKTLAVAVGGRCAVEVLLSLLGDLVDVGVLVFGRHVEYVVWCWYRVWKTGPGIVGGNVYIGGVSIGACEEG